MYVKSDAEREIRPTSRLGFRSALAALLTVVIARTDAHAQSAPSSATPSASPAPDSPALTEAREHQRRGRALLESGNPNGAHAEFQRVYDLLEGHPRRFMALSNIGRAYQALGEYDRAMEYYQRYLDEGGPQADDRAVVEASIAALNDLLGALDISVQGPRRIEIWIDNRHIRDTPGTVRVPGGRHTIEVRAEGWNASRQEVQLSSHQTIPLRFVLTQPHGLSPTLFRVGVGVTAATLVAGGVLAIVAYSARASIDAQLNSDQRLLVAGEPEDRAPIANEALAADICFGVGGALAIGTVVVAFLTDFRSHGPSAAAAPRAMFVPYTDRGVAGIGIVGSF
jgi:tetratricopeptide (TPR) repeat protein